MAKTIALVTFSLISLIRIDYLAIYCTLFALRNFALVFPFISLGTTVIPNKGLDSFGGQTSCIMGDVQMVNQKVP